MGALLDRFCAAGVRLEPTADGNLHALGTLTDELRAAIRENKAAILAELATVANDASEHDAPTDPNTERRRAKALALLGANPTWQRVVVAEAGDPAIIGVAIRGMAYGELEIPAAKYDAATLMALLEQHGNSVQ
jgi:hypothetical protein